MVNFFQECVGLFNNVTIAKHLLLVLQTISCIFKIVLLTKFCARLIKTKKVPASWWYLFIAVFCSTFDDIAWIVSLLKQTLLPGMDYRFVLTTLRIAWALNIVLYQSLALFIESFTHKFVKVSWHQMCFIVISSVFFLYPFYLILTTFNDPFNRPATEISMYFFESAYALIFLMPITLIYAWVQLHTDHSHKIVKTQIKTVMRFHILPHLLVNIFQVFPLNMDQLNGATRLLALGCSNFLLTLGLFYSLKKIIGLRFLGVYNHVHFGGNFNFTTDFKNILEILGSATTTNEVKLLSQRFFSQGFQIPTHKTFLNIRTINTQFSTDHTRTIADAGHEGVERFLESSNGKVLQFLHESKMLIYDEVEYDDFYENNEMRTASLLFLQELQADIFLPLYEGNRIIGYIIVERHARSTRLYSDVERDEMLVFATYLSKIINLLQNRNLNELLKQRKDIIEELYLKHQEINQYKESIRSFLNNNQQGIGIIFYKNKKFIFANQDAKSILGLDPNREEGHPLTKILKTITTQAFLYKTTQQHLVKNPLGKQIVISCIAHSEHNDIIFTLHYPEMYDIIKQQIDGIKDPSDWDYLLYLETTQSGKLINQLIPGNGHIFLNFKIDLLKLALSKKALLLDLPDEDLTTTVELIHHVSLRETFLTIDLHANSSHGSNAIMLFGINPLYGEGNQGTPLLEKLNKKGTLLIKNIHLLDIDSQNNLAQFIRYGFYQIFKGDKRTQSDVRIICSSNQDLALLVQENRFSQTLFNELRKTSLSMPPLLTLPEEEMNELVDGFTQQALAKNEFSSLLSLSEKDRDRIAMQRPVSLHEIKTRVQQLLIDKSKKHDVYDEDQFDTTYHISNPKLVEAARLGKYALKDPKMLSMLWNKFKSQNKIALFLGVNRSSVHRRCKDYQIT